MKGEILKLVKKVKSDEILSKSSSSFVLRVFGFLSSYLFTYIVTQYFGAETQGMFALCMATAAIFAVFPSLGFNINLVKTISSGSENENFKDLYLKIISLVTILSVILGISLFYFSEFISEQIFFNSKMTSLLKTTSFLILPTVFIAINGGVYRGLKRINIFTFISGSLGKFLLSSLFLFSVVLFFNVENQQFPLYCYLTTMWILALYSLFDISLTLFKLKGKNKYNIKNYIMESLPMLFSSSLFIFLGFIDTFMLGYFESEKIVGYYSVALKLSVLSSFFLASINAILSPVLSKLYKEKKMDVFQEKVQLTAKINFFLSGGITFVIMLFAPFFLNIYGEDFKTASTVLIILCFGQLVNSISGSVGNILNMTNNQTVFKNIILFSFILNVLLNLLLVIKYGMVGVATASVITIISWNLLSVYYVKKKLGVISFYNPFFKKTK
ncbi:MATE family efflux transporter [Aurantibacter sp.]|uniref:MATE family efflux transporter n=1 Tax=Aurantibacter sp. TaxID=2807103 RepID=UPI0035C87350